MFHKAIFLTYLEATVLAVTFEDGTIKKYDVHSLFHKYPQLKALEDRSLFLSGRLLGTSGICWNDDLDIETGTIYEDGETVGREKDIPVRVN